MKLVLGVLILVFALAGVACFGYSEAEMQLGLTNRRQPLTLSTWTRACRVRSRR